MSDRAESGKSRKKTSVTPLRQAQRDLTRNRIKNAARELFYEKHYDSTTMDEIALAAGLRRSTLYLHYRDKAEILSEVISDYAPRAQATLANLPGPRPSIEKIRRWIRSVSKFVAEERVPLSIILELRRHNDNMAALMELTDKLLSGLGRNNTPFREAARRDAHASLRARALMLLQELTFACEYYLDDTGSALGSALLQVAAQDFHQFLSAHVSVGTD